ncbi:MAG: phosphoribosylformylglycinamidine synthase subunit PurS [Endomicrobiia bacterium]
MIYKIEIYNKENIFDGLAHNLKKDILDLGIKSLKDIKVSTLYLIEGDITLSQIKTVCEKLLIDPVTQEYKIQDSKFKIEKLKNVHTVEVWFKPGVTDAVGETTRIGIKDLGIKGNFSVKTGMKYTLKGISKKEAEKIANRILANKVIQIWRIL